MLSQLLNKNPAKALSSHTEGVPLWCHASQVCYRSSSALPRPTYTHSLSQELFLLAIFTSFFESSDCSCACIFSEKHVREWMHITTPRVFSLSHTQTFTLLSKWGHIVETILFDIKLIRMATNKP